MKLALVKRNKSLICGIACGIACAICVGGYVYQVDSESKARQAEILSEYGGEHVEACVAKHDIVAGESVLESDIEMRPWATSLLPANALIAKDDVVGKQVGSTILEGEVITSSRFANGSKAIDVPDGYVAVSVPARVVQAVGGALEPGMKTDLYAVGPNSTSRLAGSIRVLATNLDSDSSANSAWVTLALNPKMVQEVITCAQNMELYFALPSSESDGEEDPDNESKDSEGSKSNG